MGRQQFTLPVKSSGTLETQSETTYPQGGDFNKDGSAYPYTLNPAETIQELILTKIGDIELTVTTSGGDTIVVDVDSAAVFNRWEIASVQFSDPNATSAQLAASWAGE
jgi:hypothetical protein